MWRASSVMAAERFLLMAVAAVVAAGGGAGAAEFAYDGFHGAGHHWSLSKFHLTSHLTIKKMRNPTASPSIPSSTPSR